MGLHKLVKILAWVFGIAGIVTYTMILTKGDKAIEAEAIAGDLSSISPIYAVAMIVLGLLLLFVVVFVLKGLASGNIKKTLLSIGAFLLVVVIGYAMSSSSIEGLPEVDGVAVTESTSKWVGTGLKTFYILAIAAIGAMLFSGVKKLTSK